MFNMGAARPSEYQLLKYYCSVADVDSQDRNGRTALPLAYDVECVCLILSYGDLSIETVFGDTALLTAAEKQRWNNCRLLYESQAVLSLRGLNRGSFLFCSLSRDHHAWLVKSSRNVRDLRSKSCLLVCDTQETKTMCRKYF